MAWTKRELVNKAYGEIGLGAMVINLPAEELQDACERMDQLTEEWGVNIGYSIPSSPSESDLDTSMDLVAVAPRAIYMNLAVEIASKHGKQVSPRTLVQADQSLRRLRSFNNEPPKYQQPRAMPRGAGNKPFGTRTEYFPGPEPTNPSESNDINDD